MTPEQWQKLLDVIEGKNAPSPTVGFIIDSPWLPGWAGCERMDYYSSHTTWFQANMQAINRFPKMIFLPGFWSEYGEITEPSAFGCKLIWDAAGLPHAQKIILSDEQMEPLPIPAVETDGLLPSWSSSRVVRRKRDQKIFMNG